jgi:hypothetical protein
MFFIDLVLAQPPALVNAPHRWCGQFCNGDHAGSDAPSGVRTGRRLRPDMSTL